MIDLDRCAAWRLVTRCCLLHTLQHPEKQYRKPGLVVMGMGMVFRARRREFAQKWLYYHANMTSMLHDATPGGVQAKGVKKLCQKLFNNSTKKPSGGERIEFVRSSSDFV